MAAGVIYVRRALRAVVQRGRSIMPCLRRRGCGGLGLALCLI